MFGPVFVRTEEFLCVGTSPASLVSAGHPARSESGAIPRARGDPPLGYPADLDLDLELEEFVNSAAAPPEEEEAEQCVVRIFDTIEELRKAKEEAFQAAAEARRQLEESRMLFAGFLSLITNRLVALELDQNLSDFVLNSAPRGGQSQRSLGQGQFDGWLDMREAGKFVTLYSSQCEAVGVEYRTLEVFFRQLGWEVTDADEARKQYYAAGG